MNTLLATLISGPVAAVLALLVKARVDARAKRLDLAAQAEAERLRLALAATSADATGRHETERAAISDVAQFRREMWERIKALETSRDRVEQENDALRDRVARLEARDEVREEQLALSRAELQAERRRTAALYQEVQELRRELGQRTSAPPGGKP